MRIEPTAPGGRHESLDLLRGVAVLGILMLNVQAFMMYFGAYQYPPAHMDVTGANATAWWTANTFFEMKFITIFSALFGAGIMLMVGDGPDGDVARHRRRMLWLLAFGLVHGLVFWFGDILAHYAVVGLIAVMLRKLAPRTLVLIGVAAIAFAALLNVGQLYAMTLMPDPNAPQPFAMNPDQETLDRFVAAFQGGFWPSRVYNAIGYAVAFLSQLISFAPRTLGLMLIGMALFKTGFFTARWSAARYGLIAVVTLGLGLPAVGISAREWMQDGFDLAALWRHMGVNYLASLFIALGYASLVMLACKLPLLALVRAPFAAAGRMAFTNYLTQTFIMVFLAVGGIGAGLYGQIERIDQVRLVLAVWAVQLVVSTVWLLVFRYGPFEWAWRSLTYGRLQPIMKRASAPALPPGG